MDNFIMIDGKKYRLVPEETQEEPVKEEPMERPTGYERASLGEKYFFEDLTTTVHCYNENHSTYDTKIYDIGNYYTDEKLAVNNSRADRLMRQLRRYAAMHGGMVFPHHPLAAREKSYYICYNDLNELYIDEHFGYIVQFGGIYFKEKQAAKQAIEEFRPELEWYFTEYEPQLV